MRREPLLQHCRQRRGEQVDEAERDQHARHRAGAEAAIDADALQETEHHRLGERHATDAGHAKPDGRLQMRDLVDEVLVEPRASAAGNASRAASAASAHHAGEHR